MTLIGHIQDQTLQNSKFIVDGYDLHVTSPTFLKPLKSNIEWIMKMVLICDGTDREGESMRRDIIT